MKLRDLGILGTVSAIGLAVGVASVAWASFSSELKIKGTATVESTKWDVAYTNISNAITTGTTEEVTHPEMTATKVGDYEVIFKNPGDSISYEITVKNSGGFDAEVTSVNIPTPRCIGSGDNAINDAKNVCDNLSYTLKYKNSENSVTVGDKLNKKGEEKTLILTLKYADIDNENLLPLSNVTIDNLDVVVTYGQSQ